MRNISISVDDKKIQTEVRASKTLLDFLRSNGILSVKRGCESGECGACAVLIDDEPRASCITLTLQADGKEIKTVELTETDDDYRIEYKIRAIDLNHKIDCAEDVNNPNNKKCTFTYEINVVLKVEVFDNSQVSQILPVSHMDVFYNQPLFVRFYLLEGQVDAILPESTDILTIGTLFSGSYTISKTLKDQLDGDGKGKYLEYIDAACRKYGTDLNLVAAVIEEGSGWDEREVGELDERVGLMQIHIDTVDGQEKMTMVSVNELLINEGHAVEYHGGKR